MLCRGAKIPESTRFILVLNSEVERLVCKIGHWAFSAISIKVAFGERPWVKIQHGIRKVNICLIVSYELSFSSFFRYAASPRPKIWSLSCAKESKNPVRGSAGLLMSGMFISRTSPFRPAMHLRSRELCSFKSMSMRSKTVNCFSLIGL